MVGNNTLKFKYELGNLKLESRDDRKIQIRIWILRIMIYMDPDALASENADI